MTIFEKANQLNGEWIDHDKYGFSRTRRFKANGNVYAMELWPHISYLFCGPAAFAFDDFEIKNTALGECLRLYYRGDLIGVVPMKEI